MSPLISDGNELRVKEFAGMKQKVIVDFACTSLARTCLVWYWLKSVQLDSTQEAVWFSQRDSLKILKIGVFPKLLLHDSLLIFPPGKGSSPKASSCCCEAIELQKVSLLELQ